MPMLERIFKSLNERSAGRWDATKIMAEFHDGVLTVHLPKALERNPNRWKQSAIMRKSDGWCAV